MDLADVYIFNRLPSRKMASLGYCSLRTVMRIKLQGRVGFRCGIYQLLQERVKKEVPSRVRGKGRYYYFRCDDIEKWIQKVSQERLDPIYPPPRRSGLRKRA